MYIGVIGAGELGELGASLAEWCAASGHDVAVASRRPEQLTSVVDHLYGHGTALPVAEAVEFADVVMFAPHWESAREAIDLAGDALTGKIVMDVTNPLVPEAGRSGFETLIEWAPDAHWAKAMNTLPPSVLHRRRGHDPLLAEFVCTDHHDARRASSMIIRDLGFAPVYAGGSTFARLTEPGGPLQLSEVDVVHATDALAEAMATAA